MTENNNSENRRIDIEEGNYNERIEGDYNIVKNIFNTFFGQQLAPVGNLQRERNQRLLLAEVKNEVTARLKQSLHNAVLINLDKELQPQQVKRIWDAEIKIGQKLSEFIPDTTTILEIFDLEEIAGKLLILGEPGSGKTTTQLELAQALIRRSEEQPDCPIPVLLNLSSWQNERQSITDWLIDELKSKYGVSKLLGQKWLQTRQILPLLDGLDEVKQVIQSSCIKCINQFLQGECSPQYLVVCSRSEEYRNHSTKLLLKGAIYLQLLTNNQIRDYLNEVNCTDLQLSIENDSNLLELIRTPLLLSVTILAFQEISIESWQQLSSTTDRIQNLLDAYVIRMLKRYISSKTYTKKKFPSVRQTRLWLVWLAKQLQTESKTEFLIEEIQPDWLWLKFQRIYYRVIYGLICGLISGLGSGLIFGMICGLICGLILGLCSGLSPLIIILTEKVILFKRTKKENIYMLICGLIGGLTSGLTSGLTFSLISGLSGGLFSGLISVLIISAEPERVVENKKKSNQGIWKSATNAVVITLIYGLIYGLILGLISRQIHGLISGLILGLFLGLFYGGGIVCIQHFLLRLILYFNGYIPWNYARFLDYCTERLFLQRIGGRYRFIHKTLQDHFANMELKSSNVAANYYYKRGISCDDLGDYQGAIEDYNQAIKLNCNDAHYYGNRGISRDKLGDYKGAIEDWIKQAIKLNSNVVVYYNKRGFSCYKSGDYQGAIEDYNQAIKLNSNDAQYYIYRAKCRNKLGDFLGAIEDCNLVIKLNSNVAQYYNNRGIFRDKSGDYQGAIEDYNKAIKLNSNDAQYYGNRAKSRDKLGDYQGAIEDYNQAIKLNSNVAN